MKSDESELFTELGNLIHRFSNLSAADFREIALHAVRCYYDPRGLDCPISDGTEDLIRETTPDNLH